MRGALLALALCGLLGTTLAGCGVSTTQGAPQASTPSPSPTATATATTTPTATATPYAGQPCSAQDFTNGGVKYIQQGDMLVGVLDFQPPTYPGYQLPEGLPLAPYKVSPDIVGKPVSGHALSNPNTGFAFSICNASASHSHVLSEVGLKILAFTPYSGHLNEVRECGMVYSRQDGPKGGGCGGGSAFDMTLAAVFAANAGQGAVAIASSNPATSEVGVLPVTLAPGHGIFIAITTTLPTAPGTYSYGVGVAVDGGQLVYGTTGTTPALFAPVAHAWDGQYCTSSAMQAQIPPATNPPTYYLCPAP
jgi:hypothetical protein